MLAALVMHRLLDSFASGFAASIARSNALLEITPQDDLYRRPRELPRTFTIFTVGEYLLRSAATIEQTFGGITTRLWDDPFEWTLPEKLNSAALIAEYLYEVSAAVDRGIAFLDSDDVLLREIPAPVAIKPIGEVLIESLTRAEHYQGRAFGVFQALSDEKLPRI